MKKCDNMTILNKYWEAYKKGHSSTEQLKDSINNMSPKLVSKFALRIANNPNTPMFKGVYFRHVSLRGRIS